MLIDDAEHYVYLHWDGDAQLIKHGEHNYRLVPGSAGRKLAFSVSFLEHDADIQIKNFSDIAQSTAGSRHQYWQQGAAIDFAGSTHPKAYASKLFSLHFVFCADRDRNRRITADNVAFFCHAYSPFMSISVRCVWSNHSLHLRSTARPAAYANIIHKFSTRFTH